MNQQSDDMYGVYIENVSREMFNFFFDWLECIIQSIILVVIGFLFVFRIVNISGRSMYNTLHDGDKIIVFKWNYHPKAGDVVVIKRGQYLDEPLIKRISAPGNQRLSLDFATGTVAVDGKILNESYIWEPMRLQGDNDIPDIIPEGYCFVMGDNRNHSRDSRFKDVGLIPYENISGKATFIIYPFDRLGEIH